MDIKKILVIAACAFLGLGTALLLVTLFVGSAAMQITSLVFYGLSLVAFVSLGVMRIIENSKK